MQNMELLCLQDPARERKDKAARVAVTKTVTVTGTPA
jgi:hypothetical protein